MDLELEHVPGSYTHPNLSRKAGRDLVAPENRPEVERVSTKTETMNQASASRNRDFIQTRHLAQ